MKIFGKKDCRKCCGKGFVTFTVSETCFQNHVGPCTCMISNIRKNIPKEDIDRYTAVFELVNGVKTMCYTSEPTAVPEAETIKS